MEVMLKLLGLSDDETAEAHSLSTQGRKPKTRSRLPHILLKGKNAQESAEFLDGDTRLTGALFIEAIVRSFQLSGHLNALKSDHLFMGSAWLFTLYCIQQSVSVENYPGVQVSNMKQARSVCICIP